jgi:hypothetical protein
LFTFPSFPCSITQSSQALTQYPLSGIYFAEFLMNYLRYDKHTTRSTTWVTVCFKKS